MRSHRSDRAAGHLHGKPRLYFVEDLLVLVTGDKGARKSFSAKAACASNTVRY